MMHNDGWDQTKLITETIAKVPLTNPPGTHWAYSNFGYCVLGRVIEQVTGEAYEPYVQDQHSWRRAGFRRCRLRQNKESQRANLRGGLLRPVLGRSLQAEHHAHGFAWWMDCVVDGACAVSQPCCGCAGDSCAAEAGDDQDDDDSCGGVSGGRCTLCAGVDGSGQWGGELVAQRESAGEYDDYGSHADGFLLGCACEYADGTVGSDQYGDRSDDVEYRSRRCRLGMRDARRRCEGVGPRTKILTLCVAK